jgi:hydrogenase maturation factor
MPPCITCSDEGRVAEVRILLDGSQAEVLDASGLVEVVDISLVEPLTPGDVVLCHAGVALTVLRPGAGG